MTADVAPLPSHPIARLLGGPENDRVYALQYEARRFLCQTAEYKWSFDRSDVTISVYKTHHYVRMGDGPYFNYVGHHEGECDGDTVCTVRRVDAYRDEPV